MLVDLGTQGNVTRLLGMEPTDDLAEVVQIVFNVSRDRRPPLLSFVPPVPGYRNLVLVRGGGRSALLEAMLLQPGFWPEGGHRSRDAVEDRLGCKEHDR